MVWELRRGAAVLLSSETGSFDRWSEISVFIMQNYRLRSRADVKDDVSCLDMPARHSWDRRWNYGTFVTSSPWQRLKTSYVLRRRNFMSHNRP